MCGTYFGSLALFMVENTSLRKWVSSGKNNTSLRTNGVDSLQIGYDIGRRLRRFIMIS
jgi:hypothetical protein